MKKLFLLLAFVFILFSLYSREIPTDSLKTVVKNFIFEQTGNFIDLSEITLLETNKSDFSNISIFLLKEGFVVTSNDDCFKPILAYSFENPFKLDVAPNADYWLKIYNNQIEYSKKIKENKYLWEWNKYLKGENLSTATKSEILLPTALWNQDEGWNNFCPVDTNGPGGHAYAGCVATAMGIIMKYWNYPLKGNSSSSYYHFTYGTLSANYGQTNYMWEYMPTTNTPNDFIALLLYHAGVSVQMDYGPDGSGSYSWKVPSALTNYFRYQNSSYIQRYNYTETNWKNTIISELNNSAPVYYSGSDNEGGHAFVCDGYRTDDDYFHFNFGWGGYKNGWYLISDAGGFTNNQAAVINIRPGSYYYPYQPSPQSFTATIDTNNFSNLNVLFDWSHPQNPIHTGYTLFINDQILADNIDANATNYQTSTDVDKTYFCLRAKYPDNKISLGLSSFINPFYQITFVIKNQANKFVKDAQVTFNNQTLITNFTGRVTFYNVPFSGNQNYTITHTQYNPVNGQMNVYKNVTLTVYLVPLDFEEKNALTIEMTNPVEDNIYLYTIMNIKSIQIFDISGKIQKDIKNAENSIFIGDLRSGVYILKIETDIGTFSEKIIKK